MPIDRCRTMCSIVLRLSPFYAPSRFNLIQRMGRWPRSRNMIIDHAAWSCMKEGTFSQSTHGIYSMCASLQDNDSLRPVVECLSMCTNLKPVPLIPLTVPKIHPFTYSLSYKLHAVDLIKQINNKIQLPFCRKLFFLCVTPNILNGFHVSSYVFLGQPKDFWCSVPDLTNSSWTDDQIRAISSA